MVDEIGGFDELMANVAAVECPFQITNPPDTPIVFKARRDKGRCRTPNKILFGVRQRPLSRRALKTMGVSGGLVI